MSGFDTFVMVDWSGGNDTGRAPRKDAIWAAVARGADVDAPVYLRNRRDAESWLATLIEQELDAGRRTLIGFDFPFGYPKGFAEALCGTPDPLALWDWIAARIEDDPKANNRFDLAGQINQSLGAGKGPFWANALSRDIAGLPRTKADYANPFPDRRTCEQRAKGAFTCWQLAGAGAVGSQVLMGLPVLTRLRQRFIGKIAVWPFEPLATPVAFVEIWPSLTLGQAPEGQIKDAWQVAEVAARVAALSPADLDEMLDVDAPEEGWIFGLGFEDRLKGQSAPVPPPLRNDCFALPAGVDWIPVDDALSHLQSALRVQCTPETVPLQEAAGRILAEDVTALRANPPHANTAVDGYGFAGGRADGPHVMPLAPDTARAGDAAAPVPDGMAVRILTGAALPPGVDTVVLQEDVNVAQGQIAFNGPIKPGNNTRRAGEDFAAGEVLFSAGRRLTPADLALSAAAGLGSLPVRKRLRLGVMSTGNELLPAGSPPAPGKIFDANRPMLLSLAADWGYEPVDLGIIPDDRALLRTALDKAAAQTDAILTSGGASAGDEDHVSALLSDAGALQMWRIAVKPGRPLALGLWDGTPVFGLPGNPVAAMVCSLIFARPALGVLAGEGWKAAAASELPAAFSKRKKPGRREYLRARIENGAVQVFASEGSGRISGLSWATGLVELPDGAAEISPGDPVRFLPFSAF